jgi:hypothetical protein
MTFLDSGRLLIKIRCLHKWHLVLVKFRPNILKSNLALIILALLDETNLFCFGRFYKVVGELEKQTKTGPGKHISRTP